MLRSLCQIWKLQNNRFMINNMKTYQCWGVSTDGRSEPLSPASDDLRRGIK